MDNDEQAKLLKEIEKSFSEYQANSEKRIKKLEEQATAGVIDPEIVSKLDKQGAELIDMKENLKKLAREQEAAKATPSDSKALSHKQKLTLGSYMKTGEIKSELTQSDSTDGGFLVEPELSDEITAVITDMGGITQVARIVTTNASGWKKAIRSDKVKTKWVGERGDRGDTDTGAFNMIEIPVHEQSTEPAVPQSMLDDAAIDLASYLIMEAGLELGSGEDKAFVLGTGNLQPQGLLTGLNKVPNKDWKFGNIGFFKSGADDGFPGPDKNKPSSAPLVNMLRNMRPAYRAMGQGLLMNRNTEAVLMNLSDKDGKPLWHFLIGGDGPQSQFAGVPIVIDDFMPDVSKDAFAIAHLTREGYYIVRRRGVTVLRDPLTNHPMVIFKTTCRVGGGVYNSEAVKLLQIGA